MFLRLWSGRGQGRATAMTYLRLRGQYFVVGAIVLLLMRGLLAVRTLTGPLIGAP